jgi:hypothetical protein
MNVNAVRTAQRRMGEEEKRYSATHCSTWHWVEVSGQLHVPAALPPGTERHVVIE